MSPRGRISCDVFKHTYLHTYIHIVCVYIYKKRDETQGQRERQSDMRLRLQGHDEVVEKRRSCASKRTALYTRQYKSVFS